LEKDAAMPDGWQLDRIRGGKGLPVSDKFVYARGQENICFRESETEDVGPFGWNYKPVEKADFL
jgi:hypothetical protein